MLCCTIMFFAATIKIEITNKTRCFFEYIYLCVCAFLVFMYCIQNREMHILNGYYSNYLTFRFTNPNLTALFVACMIMFLVVVSFQEKRVFWKCILLATAAAEIIFLYQTRSRNCMLAIAVCCYLHRNHSQPPFYEIIFLRRKRGEGFGFQNLHLAQCFFRFCSVPNFWSIFSDQQRYRCFPTA